MQKLDRSQNFDFLSYTYKHLIKLKIKKKYYSSRQPSKVNQICINNWKSSFGAIKATVNKFFLFFWCKKFKFHLYFFIAFYWPKIY